MKSRTSFFNKAIFRKNITRFFPLWVLYTIFHLLALISIASAGYPGRTARDLAESIGPMVWTNLIYGFLCAALLLGDLFQGRMCNALHALPLRREGWFFTHVVSGILFSLVPNLLIALALMGHVISNSGMWYLAFIWLLGMQLHYLFFFGLAQCHLYRKTGSILAPALNHALFNLTNLAFLLCIPEKYLAI